MPSCVSKQPGLHREVENRTRQGRFLFIQNVSPQNIWQGNMDKIS